MKYCTLIVPHRRCTWPFSGFVTCLFAELGELISHCLVSGERLIPELQENQTHLYLSAKPGLMIQEAVDGGERQTN